MEESPKYLASTSEEPLPLEFTDPLLSGRKPVIPT